VAFPVDREMLRKTETKLGRRLPESYVRRITRDNGGYVEDAGGGVWWLHPVHDDSDRRRLKRSTNDVLRETAFAREYPGFPEHGLAIAVNDYGDRLVLMPEGSDQFGSTVHCYDHENGQLGILSKDFGDLREGMARSDVGSGLLMKLANGTVESMPTPAVAKRLLRTLGIPGNEFAILERAESQYMQTHTNDGAKFVIEYREGSEKQHFVSGDQSLAEVEKAFAEYTVGVNRWKTRIKWRRLRSARPRHKPWWKIW
jgi:hypothetical protein